MTDNIIFIGIMGAGKTSVGTECSRILNRDFFDSDEIYESRYGAIADTFKNEGEEVFRARESLIIEALSNKKGAVIACGGGAVLSQSFKSLAGSGIVILLTAKLQTLLARLNASSDRPLFNGADSLQKLMSERSGLYKSYADISVETDNKAIEELALTVIKKIREKHNR